MLFRIIILFYFLFIISILFYFLFIIIFYFTYYWYLLYYFTSYWYCQEINKIGLEAFNNNLTDIFDITFLNYKDEKGMRIEDKMFSNIDTAKSNWETIMNKDFDINLNNSINE